MMTNRIKLFKEIIHVCSLNHKRDTNTICGQNAEFIKVTVGGTYSYYWPLHVFQYSWLPNSRSSKFYQF